eukprot:IDg17272t1
MADLIFVTTAFRPCYVYYFVAPIGVADRARIVPVFCCCGAKGLPIGLSRLRLFSLHITQSSARSLQGTVVSAIAAKLQH